ncbi:MAG: 5-(carboxyamino)imidazole ribonucleotide mutase [Acidobacteriota bacterium]
MNTRQPMVGIVVGSESDLPVIRKAEAILKQLDVPLELSIVSAHRTPRRLFEYAQSAHRRGLKVIIAGAGGAAHLPGMVAALTPLPVIGVPINATALTGLDSLLSIVQMPRGVPVATVAIDGGMNAGLLAAQILAAFDPQLLERLVAMRQEQEQSVLARSQELESAQHHTVHAE